MLAVQLHEVLCAFAYGVSLVEQHVSFTSCIFSTSFIAATTSVGMIVGRAMPRNAHSVAVLTVRCVLEVRMSTDNAQT